MEKFRQLGLGERLLETLKELHIREPTPIQEKAIPEIAQGHDVIGQAATGSGKTLAFGSYIIEKTQRKGGIQALVLTPTRELAVQVSKSIRRFANEYRLGIQEIYGGVSINPQIKNLERAEIVVGTPGRILDHLHRRTLPLSKVRWLVLDEADRMADMGFLPDVEEIIKACPKKRQTLLFSATTSPDVNYIAKTYMHHPKCISVESYVDPQKLKQLFYDVPAYEKFSLLIHLLKKERSQLIMIFCNTRNNVDILTRNLKRFGLHAVAIHGGLNQNKRSNVMEDFHRESVNILVCTDVAARGLHINNVSHVYNYDIPPTNTEYIHRIGRTARAGKEGEAISLVSNKDYQNFRRVLENDSLAIEKRNLPQFEKVQPYFLKERKTFEKRDRIREGKYFRRSEDGKRSFRGGDKRRGRNRGTRLQSRQRKRYPNDN